MEMKRRRKEEEIVILGYPSTDKLAKEIKTILRKQREDITITRGKIHWDSFPDGFPNLFIADAEKLKSKKILFLASFRDPSTLFPQLSLLYSLPRLSIHSLFILLSYFPTGTMERVDTEGQVATAKSLTRMMGGIPLTQTGPAIVMIYDIHALQERFYFDDCVIPSLHSAIPLFKSHLLLSFPSLPQLLRLSASDYPLVLSREEEMMKEKEEEKDEGEVNIAIAFPDEGAAKRFGKYFAEYPIITCSKVRIGNQRKVTIKEGKAKGKHVIIVDDLIQTGGTIIECKEALFDHGAHFVSAYVTHPVFPLHSWRKFAHFPPPLPSNNNNNININDDEGEKKVEGERKRRSDREIREGRMFTYFYTTNSVAEVAELLVPYEPFRVLSIAPLVADHFSTYL